MIAASTQSSYPGRFTPLVTASQPLKDSGIEVYVLGVGRGVDEQELNDVASRPENVYREPVSRLSNFGPALWDSWKDYIRKRGKLIIHMYDQNCYFFLVLQILPLRRNKMLS